MVKKYLSFLFIIILLFSFLISSYIFHNSVSHLIIFIFGSEYKKQSQPIVANVKKKKKQEQYLYKRKTISSSVAINFLVKFS